MRRKPAFPARRPCLRPRLGRGHIGLLASIVLGLSAAGAVPAGAPAAPEPFPVEPKTAVERPEFTTQALVLRDGALLAYYVRPGTGPTLILIPETNGDRAQYFTEEFLARIDRTFHLVVIETRGQGRSWPPPTPAQASIAHYAEDAIEVARHLGLAGWYVGGHSLGGMTAIAIAGRKPAGLRGVIALEGWVHSRVPELAFAGHPPRTEAQNVEARRQREARYLSHRWTAEEYASLTRMWRAWTEGEAIMRDTTYPLLAVFGDRGRPQRPGRAALLLPDKPNVELAWIAGAGHQVTAPPFAGEVATAINHFIARVEALPGPRVVRHQIVWREPGRFAGWPANNGAWAWGDELLVGFTAGWHKIRDVQRHQIDDARPAQAAFARSLDGGATWHIEMPPTVPGVEEAMKKLKPLAEPIDFLRPGFALTLRFHASGRPFFYYSYDKGHLWSGPFAFPDLGTPGIEARTDYLVHGDREMTVFLTARKANGKEGRPFCARTTDGGVTWERQAYIGPEPEDFVIMPSTVALDEKTFLTTVRVKQGDRPAWIDAWISRDRGKSWDYCNRPAPDTGFKSGNPPDLLRLRDGRLCLIYGYRSAPRGIRARLSQDQGATWGEEIVLRADAVTHDLGYPRSFQRADGRILTVYYYNDGAHTERFIAATEWEPGLP